jgi:predicted rRNA methylase YqxC with S4 and FtsJ domains
VSFISLKRILRGVAATVIGSREIVALVKPVVDHAGSLGLRLLGRIESPLTGPAGNHEFLIHLSAA